MQRTNLGLVLFSVCIRRVSCSLYVWPTVRNIPLRVAVRPPKAADGSPADTVAPMPTISADISHASCTKFNVLGNNRADGMLLDINCLSLSLMKINSSSHMVYAKLLLYSSCLGHLHRWAAKSDVCGCCQPQQYSRQVSTNDWLEDAMHVMLQFR